MANFCENCGSPLSGPFCVKCGADMRSAGSVQRQPPATTVQTPALKAAPAPAVPIGAKPGGMSPLVKLGVAAVVIIFVGGAVAIGGVLYVAHRVSQKVHEVAGEFTGSAPDQHSGASPAGSGSANGTSDACSLLTQEDVSRAIGVEIIRAQPGENSCSYIAKGDQADMTAKHTTAMMAARGADKKSQQMIQTFAGGMFKTFQSESKEAPSGTPGEVMVFSFSIDTNSAGAQMQLNSKTLRRLGPTGAQSMPGIGDEAFVSGDSMVMVRKGEKLIRIMYMTCPCGTDAVKPLAKKIADAL